MSHARAPLRSLFKHLPYFFAIEHITLKNVMIDVEHLFQEAPSAHGGGGSSRSHTRRHKTPESAQAQTSGPISGPLAGNGARASGSAKGLQPQLGGKAGASSSGSGLGVGSTQSAFSVAPHSQSQRGRSAAMRRATWPATSPGR